MTTQIPTIGASTPTGYQPARGTVIDPANPAASRPTPGAGPDAGAAANAVLAKAPTTTGSAPGAGASIAAPDTSALGQDPTYLAYMRALGVADTTHSAAIQQQVDAQNRMVNERLPGMVSQDNAQRGALLGRMESRGILNSGETEQNMNRLQAAQGGAITGLQQNAADRINSLVNQLAQFRANQGVSATEQGLKAGQVIAQGNGTTQLNTDLANASATL
jgi:hypothetical protein